MFHGVKKHDENITLLRKTWGVFEKIKEKFKNMSQGVCVYIYWTPFKLAVIKFLFSNDAANLGKTAIEDNIFLHKTRSITDHPWYITGDKANLIILAFLYQDVATVILESIHIYQQC